MTFRPHGRGLPPLTAWQHRPLLCRAAPEVAMNCELASNIPLNHYKTVQFETELFVGEAAFRVRDVGGAGQDPWEPEGGVYSGKKRLLGVVIQGKFKKQLTYADVQAGFLFHKPITVGILSKTCLAACKMVQSGLEYDLHAQPCYLRNLLVSSCDTLTITPAGEKPPCVIKTLPVENTGWADKKARRGAMRNEQTRQTIYDTTSTYTFTFYSDKIDLTEFRARLPWPAPNLHMDQYTNGQALPLEARTVDGEVLWRFEMWHESVLAKADPEVMEPLRGILDKSQSFTPSLAALGVSFRKVAIQPRCFEKEPPPEDRNVADRLHSLRARVLSLSYDQTVLHAQMEAMLKTSRPEAPLANPTAAHLKLQKIVSRALDRTADGFRDNGSTPFSEEETYAFLGKLVENTNKVAAEPATSPKKKKKKRAGDAAAPASPPTAPDAVSSAAARPAIPSPAASPPPPVPPAAKPSTQPTASGSTAPVAAAAAAAGAPPAVAAVAATAASGAAPQAVAAVAADHAIGAAAQRNPQAATAVRAAGGVNATPESIATVAATEAMRRDPRAAAAITAGGGPKVVAAKATRVTVC